MLRYADPLYPIILYLGPKGGGGTKAHKPGASCAGVEEDGDGRPAPAPGVISIIGVPFLQKHVSPGWPVGPKIRKI